MMDDHTADETFRGDANKDKCIKFFHGVKSVGGGGENDPEEFAVCSELTGNK